jgi:hypothetical protein
MAGVAGKAVAMGRNADPYIEEQLRETGDWPPKKAFGEDIRMVVTSVAEWAMLPEIACPAIESEASKGSIFTVHKIGFLAVGPADCVGVDLSGAVFAAGKYMFQTAVVEFEREKKLCRLPHQVGNWAIDTVAVAQKLGRSPFPMQVEFGILRGRYYAEML